MALASSFNRFAVRLPRDMVWTIGWTIVRLSEFGLPAGLRGVATALAGVLWSSSARSNTARRRKRYTQSATRNSSRS